MKRKLFDTIIQHLPRKEFTIITGARQTGKTTLLRQVKDKLIEGKKNVSMLSFEDPDILQAINQHPENIFKFIPDTGKKGKLYMLLDEVQYAANPSNFLKYLFDKYYETLKIVATGSSAFYIDRNFKDSLAGRKRIFELYTLDFEEFLDFKGKHDLVKEWYQMQKDIGYHSQHYREIHNLFDEYLIYGGYPAVALEKNNKEKKELLSELVTTFLKRDVIESNISDFLKVHNLIKLLASLAGNIVNINDLSKKLRYSSAAIENYLYVLQKCYHIHLLRPFYRNLSKELIKMPKIYFNDLGVRNTLLNYFDPVSLRFDKGFLLENYVFIRLRQLYGTDQMNFWRTADGNEIDFIVTENARKGLAIEVKFDDSAFSQVKYAKFTNAYKEYELQCKSYTCDHEEHSVIRF